MDAELLEYARRGAQLTRDLLDNPQAEQVRRDHADTIRALSVALGLALRLTDPQQVNVLRVTLETAFCYGYQAGQQPTGDVDWTTNA